MYSFVYMRNEFLLKEFGDRIKKLRLEKNFSQEKLSFLTGFHRTYIGMNERGERNISIKVLVKISNALEIPVSKILENIEHEL